MAIEVLHLDTENQAQESLVASIEEAFGLLRTDLLLAVWRGPFRYTAALRLVARDKLADYGLLPLDDRDYALVWKNQETKVIPWDDVRRIIQVCPENDA